jgi:hypothetical protein
MLFLKSCLRRKLLPLSCIIYPEIIEFPMGSDKELERYIQYNKFTDPVHYNPDFLIASCTKLLKCQYNQRYFSDAIESFQCKLFQEKTHLENYLARNPTRELTPEKLAIEHCRRLEGILRFLCVGSSDNLRTSFLELVIFADRINLFVDPGIYTDDDSSLLSFPPKHDNAHALRRRRIEFIQGFSRSLLRRIQEDPEYVKEVFERFYQDTQEPATELIRFVLEKTFLSIRKYDWHALPHYYNQL